MNFGLVLSYCRHDVLPPPLPPTLLPRLVRGQRDVRVWRAEARPVIALVAFLAGVLAGACGLALSALAISARTLRRAAQRADRRPFDDRRPEERR